MLIPFINVHYDHLKFLVPVKNQRCGLSFLLLRFSFRAYNISLYLGIIESRNGGCKNLHMCNWTHLSAIDWPCSNIGEGVDTKWTVQTNYEHSP